MPLTTEQKKQVGMAVAFAVIIILLVVIILVKWKPDCFSTAKKVRFDETPTVHEVPARGDEEPEEDPNEPMDGQSSSTHETAAVSADRLERDEQNSMAFQLLHRSGRAPPGGMPTTATMMMAARDTRLEGGHSDNSTTLADRLSR